MYKWGCVNGINYWKLASVFQGEALYGRIRPELSWMDSVHSFKCLLAFFCLFWIFMKLMQICFSVKKE